jgi:hypothetical protein
LLFDGLREHLLGCLRPHEGLGALVVAGDEAVDRGDQLADVGVAAAADVLAREDREPALDEVHPGGAGGGEVEVDALVADQPALDLGCRVGGGVVEHEVQLAGGELAHDPAQEGEELLVAVARLAGGHDLAGGDLERGIEVGGAVSLVVVRAPLGQAGAQRQDRLRAVERLHLRLLVDAEDERALGRVEVEADDVDHLRDQLRVAAVLERARAVRLQPVRAPDPVHGRAREPRLPRQPAHAPVRLAGGGRLERLGQHPLHRLLVDRARSPRAWPIGQAGETLARKLGAPQAHRRQRQAQLAGDLRVARPVGRPQHDPRPHRVLLRTRGRPCPPAELRFLLGRERDRGGGTRHRHNRTTSPFYYQGTIETEH